jgi:hypothetical protein
MIAAVGIASMPGTHSRSSSMNENLSLIAMCFFLVASLAFLADQILSYH